ncbi:hypothetical protein [Enterobacter hormaechei]|uniref:hypothetical protein n=1 Tax=Enterobacter hormaechei TaxID=158836 RepID=UPI001F3C3341|nr:hypothetical protein [Enterobacter hormaechei]
MGKISLNGAVFIFMARGEKLQDSDAFPSNGTPDQKYVLWPRGEGWDVRYLKFGSKGGEWMHIAENLFANEAEAWQGAYDHWMNIYNKRSSVSNDSDDGNRLRLFKAFDKYISL